MNQDMMTFIAPLSLVLGAGLFAAGVLSFFDIHFFKNRFAERAALAGGLGGVDTYRIHRTMAARVTTA
jgi:hypothetical protein